MPSEPKAIGMPLTFKSNASPRSKASGATLIVPEGRLREFVGNALMRTHPVMEETQNWRFQKRRGFDLYSRTPAADLPPGPRVIDQTWIELSTGVSPEKRIMVCMGRSPARGRVIAEID